MRPKTYDRPGYRSCEAYRKELENITNVELRLELAEAEATKVTTWKGSFQKKDRIAAITKELIVRGAF